MCLYQFCAHFWDKNGVFSRLGAGVGFRPTPRPAPALSSLPSERASAPFMRLDAQEEGLHGLRGRGAQLAATAASTTEGVRATT